MPHQCTGCGHTFEDGSKEMLSGCPDCGGNKFQFRPSGTSSVATASDSEPDSEPDSESNLEPDSELDTEPEPPREASSVAETVGRATTRVRDFVSAEPESEPDPNADWPDAEDEIIDADARADRANAETEDLAQASARSDVVSDSELSSATADADRDDGEDPSSAIPGGEPATDGRVVSEPSGDEPDMAELREQLNDQFESIKILEPGQYELNLMELYDREEYIIALQENGRYVIQVPDQWIGDDIDDR